MLARFQEGTGGNIWLKLEKLPNFPTFLKGIFQVVPSTYEHLCLHIPDLSQPSSNLRKGNKQLFSVLSTVSEPQGGTSILGGRGAWPQNLPLKFLLELLQKYRWQIPQILPSEFQIWPQNWDFLPTFASCNNRASQVLVNLAGPCPNFASKLDVRSKPPPNLLIWKYPLGFWARQGCLQHTEKF